jgi:hypothetical protein
MLLFAGRKRVLVDPHLAKVYAQEGARRAQQCAHLAEADRVADPQRAGILELHRRATQVQILCGGGRATVSEQTSSVAGVTSA